ncbi:MAG: malto-oligosyltrehalose trehalohydrolase, partial [Planctomycetota bacterium]
GVTALQLMPVAQFPGERNWGYDGVAPYAAQSSYGGVDGLRRLVDAAHRRGLAVFLDVVYNHLGPEGNSLSEFGPYFTERYRTPWGAALNFDGPGADEVRSFFVDNALWWTIGCHLDGLRLDAVHAIHDQSADPLLEELTREVHEAARAEGRVVRIVAESSANDPRLVRPTERGGLGMDGQWNDDFHHAVHALVTGEREGYYVDFGEVSTLAKAFRDGYVLTGQRSAFYGRRHGRPAPDLPPSRLVVFAQNHDQVGNRAGGERLAALVDPAACRMAAAIVLLSPFVPLLFMGEEHADPAPFLYFTSHGDPHLTASVRQGRREELSAFAERRTPPDPASPTTFERSRIDWSLRSRPGPHARMLAFHRELLALRRGLGKRLRSVRSAVADDESRTLHVQLGSPLEGAALLGNFADEPRRITLPEAATGWTRRLDSADAAWGGPGGDSPPRAPAGRRTTVGVTPWTTLLYVGER